jgi:hypothetical protein
MKLHLNFWNSAIALATVSAVTVTSSLMPAIADNHLAQDATPMQEAAPATSIIGQCRAVKHNTPIFSDRAAISPALRLLSTNDEVILGENSAVEGMILVSAPVRGYVFTANLKSCGTGTPPPTGLCRQVINPPQGLFIRTKADPDSPLANPSGVGYRERVTLTTSPATIKEGAEGRIWVQISSPAAGWVSNGFRGSAQSNLGFCE